MHADLVLSSGFLAFARHAGFLAAIEERGIQVDALCGTSSGAVCAALVAAGKTSSEIGALFDRGSMMGLARVSSTFWRGLMSMDTFTDFLRPHLPSTFEELARPLAVGVVDAAGKHALLKSGPLPEAVAASCAMPGIFGAVNVGGQRFADGGAADRLGLDAYRAWRPNTAHVIANWVERTAGKDVQVDAGNTQIIKTPRSGARFWNLGDVRAQMDEARRITLAALVSG
jgi:predicted acylesterase/phospholipase RssA